MAGKGSWRNIVLLLCLLVVCLEPHGDCSVLRGEGTLNFTLDAQGRLLIGQNGDKKPKPNVRLGKLIIGNPTVGSDTASDGEKAVKDSPQPSNFQSDQADWSDLQHLQGSVYGYSTPRSLAVQRLLGMKARVECVGDAMMLNLRGETADFGRGFLIDRGTVPPLPLWKVPSDCGFHIRRTILGLAIIVPYDGCYVALERDSYILPLNLWGLPAKMSCPLLNLAPSFPTPPPLPTPLPSPPSLSCYPNGMIVKTLIASENLLVKVENKWQPLLKASSKCGFSLVFHEEGVVISVPYKPCMELKDGLYSLYLGAKKEFRLFCPSFVPHLPLNLSSPVLPGPMPSQSFVPQKPVQVILQPTSVPTSTLSTTTMPTTTTTKLPITPQKDYQMPYYGQRPQLPNAFSPFPPSKPQTTTASPFRQQNPKPVSVTSSPVTTIKRPPLKPSNLFDDTPLSSSESSNLVPSHQEPVLPSRDIEHSLVPSKVASFVPSGSSSAQRPQWHYSPQYLHTLVGFHTAAPSQPVKILEATRPLHQAALQPGYLQCCPSAAWYSNCCPPPVSYHQHSHHYFGPKRPILSQGAALDPTRNVSLQDPVLSIAQSVHSALPVSLQGTGNYQQPLPTINLQDRTKVFRKPSESLFPAPFYTGPLGPTSRPQTVLDPLDSSAKQWGGYVPHFALPERSPYAKPDSHPGHHKPKPNQSDYRPAINDLISQSKIPLDVLATHSFAAKPETTNQFLKLLEDEHRLLKQPQTPETRSQPNFQKQVPSISGVPNAFDSDQKTGDPFRPEFQVASGPFTKYWAPVMPQKQTDYFGRVPPRN